MTAAVPTTAARADGRPTSGTDSEPTSTPSQGGLSSPSCSPRRHPPAARWSCDSTGTCVQLLRCLQHDPVAGPGTDWAHDPPRTARHTGCGGGARSTRSGWSSDPEFFDLARGRYRVWPISQVDRPGGASDSPHTRLDGPMIGWAAGLPSTPTRPDTRPGGAGTGGPRRPGSDTGHSRPGSPESRRAPYRRTRFRRSSCSPRRRPGASSWFAAWPTGSSASSSNRRPGGHAVGADLAGWIADRAGRGLLRSACWPYRTERDRPVVQQRRAAGERGGVGVQLSIGERHRIVTAPS